MTSRETTAWLTRVPALASAPLIADRLFTVAWALVQWPWLLRSLSGGSPAERAALLARLDLPADALPHLGSWKADAHFLHLAADAIEQRRPAQVVELGAGATSLVLARALEQAGSGWLTSYDEHADFIAATAAWLESHGLRADFRTATPAPAAPPWRGSWYSLPNLPDRIDLLVVDAPPWTNHPFVRGAADALFPRVAIGGLLLLDDAARPGERVVAQRWRARWPGWRFALDRRGTKGTLVGERLA